MRSTKTRLSLPMAGRRVEAMNLTIGGDLPVHRLRVGAMRLTRRAAGLGRGRPPGLHRSTALGIARRAVELGVTFIDTADSYDLGANETLLADALHPYRQ